MHNINDLQARIIEETGVDIFRIYCAITGKPIGRLDDETLAYLEAEVANMDSEEAMDDLYIRTLASMRPSPAWNSLKIDSLAGYATTRPVETLTYLLIRLYEPASNARLKMVERFDMYYQRIMIYRTVSRLIESGINVQDWLYLLLEVDAKCNLSTLPIPANDLLLTLTLVQELGVTKDFLENWTAWHDKHVAAYDRAQQRLEEEARWFKGNTLARSAYLNLWMERKPPSKTRLKKQAKAKSTQMMEDIFNQLMDTANPAFDDMRKIPEAKTTVAPRVATKAPKFGARR